jgi:hypothetical protein
MEHRWGSRIRANYLVAVTDGTAWAAIGRARDISASGVFLACRPPPSFRQVRIQVQSPRRTLTLRGYIVRIARDGIGVEWEEFAPTPLHHLLRTSARKRPAPERAARGVRKRKSLHLVATPATDPNPLSPLP